MDTQTRPDSHTTLLSQRTSFVGREAELAEITALLSDPHCRLLTLVGPGGSGKTRLAVEVARQLDFADGVFVVPLQPLQTPVQVVGTIISVLNIPPDNELDQTQLLLEYLQAKQLLLILDNFEHLMVAADLVAKILYAAPQVKLLVTSREPLNLHEEWVREVRGLTYPNNGTISDAPQYSALQLFAQRARRLQADFSLDNEIEHVVRICQLVDGLPLALELAAGWLRTLSCEAIVNEIETNVDILASNTRNLPERHRSMRAVFDHSWQLLTDEERAVLPRFSVFRGGCDREAAEQVAGATLLIVASLVEKSLLRYDANTDRYDMHELLRQYAQEQLEISTDDARVRDTHAHYYATFFASSFGTAFGSGKPDFGMLIHTELDNIRISWSRALARENHEVIDQFIEPLWAYFTSYNRTFELGTLYQAAVEQLAVCTEKREQAILGRLLARLGKWDAVFMHIDQAETCFRQSMAIAQEHGDAEEYHYASRWLALYILANYRFEYIEAVALLEKCVKFYREQGNKFHLGQSLSNLGRVYGKWGFVERQNDLLHETYQVFEAIDHRMGMKETLNYLGNSAIHEGRWDEAQRIFSVLLDSIPTEKNAFFEWMEMEAHHGLMTIAAMCGNFAQAKQQDRTILALSETSDKTHFRTFEITLGFHLNQSMLMVAIDGTSVVALHKVDEVILSADERGGFPELAERGRVIRAWVLCDLEQFDQSSQEMVVILPDMLRYYRLSVNLMLIIASASRILAHQGDTIRAVELLALAFSHPNSPRGYLKRHQGMTQLRRDLEARLGAVAFAAAWERGAKFDVEQTARDLLREFGSTEADPIASANQSLPAPLTSRELDVLALLADGLTNPQIAERLFITTGTVKGHVNKILHKLDARDRHQAVIRAQELHLLDL